MLIAFRDINANASCHPISNVKVSKQDYSQKHNKELRSSHCKPFMFSCSQTRPKNSNSLAQVISHELKSLKIIRGGILQHESTRQHINRNITSNNKGGNSKKKVSVVTISALSVALLSTYWRNHEIINEWFVSTFDTAQFKRRLLETLESIDEKGNMGLLVYIFIFTWWEVFGLPSSIVETVAGMAFGCKRAFIANAIGKYSGMCLMITFM